MLPHGTPSLFPYMRFDMKRKKIYSDKKFKPKKCRIDLYFGVPGAGKTTWAAHLAHDALKQQRPVFSNVLIKGAFQFDKKDLGINLIENALVIIDEAGLEFDNRKMSMSDDEIYFFKYHRHYQNDVVFLSQGLDVDIKIRKLAQRYFLLLPSIFPNFILRKEIVRKVGIDDNGQIVDKFDFKPFIAGGWSHIFAPKFRKYFNTLDRKPLKIKNYEVWK